MQTVINNLHVVCTAIKVKLSAVGEELSNCVTDKFLHIRQTRTQSNENRELSISPDTSPKTFFKLNSAPRHPAVIESSLSLPLRSQRHSLSKHTCVMEDKHIIIIIQQNSVSWSTKSVQIVNNDFEFWNLSLLKDNYYYGTHDA